MHTYNLLSCFFILTSLEKWAPSRSNDELNKKYVRGLEKVKGVSSNRIKTEVNGE